MKRARSWSIEHTLFVLIVGIPLLFYACLNWMAHEKFELLRPVESFDGVTVQIVYVEQGFPCNRDHPCDEIHAQMTYVCTVEDVNGFMAGLTDLTYRYPLGTPSDWLPAGNAVLLVYPDDTQELIAVECQAQIGLETAHATYRGSFDTEEWNAFLEKWMQ